GAGGPGGTRGARPAGLAGPTKPTPRRVPAEPPSHFSDGAAEPLASGRAVGYHRSWLTERPRPARRRRPVRGGGVMPRSALPGLAGLAAALAARGGPRAGDDPLPEGAVARLKPGGPPTALAFSPDGRTLATAVPDATVRFWRPRTGQEARPALAHLGSVAALAFSPDGRAL